MTYNLDPGALRSFPVMSEETLQIVRVPQRAIAPIPEPVMWTPWEAAVVIRYVGEVGTDKPFGASFHTFTYLPAGTKITVFVRKPDGEIYLPSKKENMLFTPGTGWGGDVWYGPFPVGWPVGVTTFTVVVTLNGKEYTAIAQIATGGVYPAGDSPRFGPLEGAVVDSAGGILLSGLFKTPPVVVAPSYRDRAVLLEGGNYVPPGSIGSGTKPLGVCSGIDGNPNHLECTTTEVTIPVFQ